MLERLSLKLAEHGMEVLGVFSPLAGENGHKATQKETGIVIANCGQDMWRIFVNSNEYQDGLADPMERWSAGVLGVIAAEYSATLILPFEQPFPPFQTWTKRAAQLHQSELGILIHPKYGLWFGLRGVMFVDAQSLGVAGIAKNEGRDICASCAEKPCLDACPVAAFGNKNLQVDKCFTHLKSNHDPDCMKEGCAARAACPVGKEYQYSPEQLVFHMGAYFKAGY